MPIYSVNLVGPSEITCLENGELGKRVYMMGEYHEKNPQCPGGLNYIEIWQFMLNVVANYEQLPFDARKDIDEQMMDIFLEIPYIEKDIIRYRRENGMNQYIDDIENLFAECLVKTNKRCPKRTRLHFADIRRTIPKIYGNPAPSEYPYASCLANQQELAYMIRLDPSYRNGFIEYLKKWTSEDIFSSKEIKDQFDPKKHSNPNYINALKQITIDKNNQMIDKKKSLTTSFLNRGAGPVFIDIYREIRRNMDSPYINDTNAFEIFTFETIGRNYTTRNRINIREWLIDRVALSMDTYLLARLLKDYVRNAIVYVGLYHSRDCVETLEQLGFRKTVEEKDAGPGKNGFQCLNLNRIPELTYYANTDQSKMQIWNPNLIVQNRPRIPVRKIIKRKINKKRVMKRRQRNIRKYKKHY